MSQAKVDRYKEEKKNRKKNIQKAKRKKTAFKVLCAAICVAFVAWIGYSGYRVYQKNKPVVKTDVNLDATTDYLNSLTVPQEGADS